jgi:hypothetical protein
LRVLRWDKVPMPAEHSSDVKFEQLGSF